MKSESTEVPRDQQKDVGGEVARKVATLNLPFHFGGFRRTYSVE
jgi:hypothetical protein